MHRLTVQYGPPDDAEAFDTHYFGIHVPLCEALPGLRQASFSKPRVLGPGEAPYLVAELDFDDADALKTALKSQQMAEVGADAENINAPRVMFTGEVTNG